MIRVLILVLAIFVLGAGFAWLADHPGTLTLSVAGYDISTTVMAAAIIIVVALVLLAILWLVLRAVFRAPRNVIRHSVERKRELGYQALSKGFVAVGAGDSAGASHFAAESRHYAHNDPLSIMLAAQAAQLAGDTMGARAAYETMLARPETRLLGLRGLFGEARRRGDATAARSFAEEAMKEKPGIAWAGDALLEFQAAEGEWAAALDTLSAITHGNASDVAHSNRLRAVLLTARAEEIERGEPEMSRDLALEAHRLVPSLVPAAVIASRLSSRLGDAKRAGKVLETTWKIDPHPELAAAYMAIRPGESGRDRLKRVRQLTKIRANHLEGQLALARAAIDAQEWSTAREELRGVLATHPSERAFVMMAEIEEGEHSDIGRARDWLSRAVRAPRDPTWMADGYSFDHWEPVSPISGRIDAFEWKAPVERMHDDEAERLGAPITPSPSVDRPAPKTEEPAKPAVSSAPEFIEPAPLAEPVPSRAMVPIGGRALFPVSRNAIDVPSDDEDDEADTTPESVPATNGAAPDAQARQPDDPGPDGSPEPPTPEPPPKRRFRLFG